MHVGWNYEKLKDDGTREAIYNSTNDYDGRYTGKHVINVKAYFDEHPDEAIARGWTKHITFSEDEIKEKWPHNKQTEYLLQSVRRIDEHTVEDVYHVVPKSEAMMALEEMMQAIDRDGSITWT